MVKQIFNDYILTKNDKIEIIIGENGDRLPLNTNNITGSKNYNDLLPYVNLVVVLVEHLSLKIMN